ncbi:MAG TPA: paraquat-inducible protein A [Bdellovibrio sp.]|uniref:paraquat-inducible protein A n=1 Tax=Bdellovibrio sp. TaxID=28201 RepID=UPI002F09D207
MVEKKKLQHPQAQALTLSFSVTALIFYIPANVYPFMTIEMYGMRNTSTVWGGIVTLADKGSWAIAAVVFLASIVIPFVKLAILFYLTLTDSDQNNSDLKLKLYRFVEAIGRWSMLDIFLLAVVVAVFKFGHMARVQPGIGSLMFLFVVIFTMLASAYYDPSFLEENENGK